MGLGKTMHKHLTQSQVRLPIAITPQRLLRLPLWCVYREPQKDQSENFLLKAKRSSEVNP